MEANSLLDNFNQCGIVMHPERSDSIFLRVDEIVERCYSELKLTSPQMQFYRKLRQSKQAELETLMESSHAVESSLQSIKASVRRKIAIMTWGGTSHILI